MSYYACIQDMEGFLKVTVVGTMESKDELFDLAHLLVRMGEEYRTTRGLIDKRQLDDRTDLLDVYQLSESELTAQSVVKGVRIACLAAPENLERLTAFETVMQNRSLNYRIFTEEEEAAAWLQK